MGSIFVLSPEHYCIAEAEDISFYARLLISIANHALLEAVLFFFDDCRDGSQRERTAEKRMPKTVKKKIVVQGVP